MKQRQSELKRVEEQHTRQNNNDNGGLRVSLMKMNFPILFLSLILVANELILLTNDLFC